MNGRTAGRFAFVLPRCGEGVTGGAEALGASLARRLARRGDKVEILTTCARDNRTWRDEFPPGPSVEDGLVVRRFPTDPIDPDVWVPLQLRLSEGLRLSPAEELDWLSAGVNAPGLYEHIAQRGDVYDALLCGPYLFGTTFFGALTRPDKAVLIPCLHDEPYAYTGAVRAMFTEVGKALWNAPAEQRLASRLYGAVKGGEVGVGFTPAADEEIWSAEPYFADDSPYLVYFGRKETGKNVQLLVDRFTTFKDGPCPARFADLKLVIAGGGSFDDVGRPAALLRPDVVDLGHLAEADKRRVIRHSSFLCQPSVNESFSIVLMEAWRLEVPVLVNARCDVTREHVDDSGGGLYFGSQDDFDGAVELLLGDAVLRRRMGRAGRAYVGRRYDWGSVLARFDAAMADVGLVGAG